MCVRRALWWRPQPPFPPAADGFGLWLHVSQRPTEENLHELATCYSRAGQLSRAIAVLAGAQREENRYLLAACCFQQGKLTEAEDALLQNDGGRDAVAFGADRDDNIPMGAAGLYLMGRICKRGNRREQAVDYLIKRCGRVMIIALKMLL